MQPYLDLLSRIATRGVPKDDRTGTGTLSIFGAQVRSDLWDGFPLLTTRAINYRAAIHEMQWFLRGETNTRTLPAKIWDQWAAEDGSLGAVYGAQMRGTSPNQPVDQIAQLLTDLQVRPDSRRLVVSCWTPSDMPDESVSPEANARAGKAALAWCHCLFQVWTRPLSVMERRSLAAAPAGADSAEAADLDAAGVPARGLSLHLYQRSADMPVAGCAFNVVQYAYLTHLLAEQSGMVADEFVHTIGDAHIYRDQLDGVHEQLQRAPRALPQFRFIRTHERIEDYGADDIEITGYDPHPPIRFPVAK